MDFMALNGELLGLKLVSSCCGDIEEFMIATDNSLCLLRLLTL